MSHARFFCLLACIFVLSIFVVTSRGWASRSCYATHDRIELDFKKIIYDVKKIRRESRRFGRQALLSKDKARAFLKSGWPLLESQAREKSISIKELLGDTIALMELYNSQNPGAWRSERSERFLASIDYVERAVTNGKLKQRDWMHVERLMSGFYDIGVHVSWAQYLHFMKPTFHPYSRLTSGHFEKVFEAIEELTWDRLLEDLMPRPRRENLKFEEVIQNPEEIDRSEGQAPVPDSFVSHETRNLALALKLDIPLVEDQVYQAKTIYGRELEVTVESEIVRAMSDPNEARVIRKLLRNIVTGRGSISGIKRLDLGPDLIEIKGIFRTHKRIIGCLVGNRLILKKYLEIPASRAAYSRRIPANLCQGH